MVRVVGVEPTASEFQTRSSTTDLHSDEKIGGQSGFIVSARLPIPYTYSPPQLN